MSRPRAGAIAVGASAGAVEALSEILPRLPAGYPLPILMVVHLPAEGDSHLPEVLGRRCRLEVKEAEDKEPIRGGTVYLAPPDYHLLVEPDRRLSLSGDEPVRYCRPSVDVLFESAADAYGDRLVAVVLSGANDDGARGLRLVREAGGLALVQRPDEATAPAMPRAALDACPGAVVLGLGEIARHLIEVAEPA